MSSLGCVLNGLSWLLTLSTKYSRIKADPEYKARTSYFGVYAIIMSITMAGLFVLCLWGVFAMIDCMDEAGIGIIMMVIFIIMLIIVALYIALEYIFGGLMGVIYQFLCNRRPISWIALVVFIVTAVGMAVGSGLVIGMAVSSGA